MRKTRSRSYYDIRVEEQYKSITEEFIDGHSWKLSPGHELEPELLVQELAFNEHPDDTVPKHLYDIYRSEIIKAMSPAMLTTAPITRVSESGSPRIR